MTDICNLGPNYLQYLIQNGFIRQGDIMAILEDSDLFTAYEVLMENKIVFLMEYSCCFKNSNRKREDNGLCENRFPLEYNELIENLRMEDLSS